MSVSLWTTSLRRLLADLGRGGSSWTATRGGVSAGTLTGYAVPDLPSPFLAALLGDRAAAPGWYWLCASSTDVRVGDILTSVSEATLVFTVRTADPVASVRICRIEPKR